MASNFMLNIQKFIDKAEGRADLVVKKTALELFTRVILKTPVDTGRARGNWNCAVGTKPAPRIDVNKLDKEGQESIAEAQKVILSGEAGKTIYLTNNLPYIEVLEDGHSQKQAPHGMVKVTVLEFQQVIDSVVNEVKGGSS